MGSYRSHTFDTIVIGSGCAGYNAADWLYELGCTDVAILTEGIDMGTSRNTGSDKQTYYKLGLSGAPDSVREMAASLYGGKSVNGDTAYAEAAGSVKCFMKLCTLGVPFPVNAYGEYVGYQTDHDVKKRGTSAGPLTSRYMVEALQKQVEDKKIPIFDGMTAIRILTENNRVYGLIALDRDRADHDDYGVTLFYCRHIIMATGGEAGVYARSVYPVSQTGMTGMALEAGALASNLQEWQYGLASVGFRWNVSGTYQQVLPRYISVDKNGREKELLPAYFHDPYDGLNRVFLKGYQWPFDVNRLEGSSHIDLIVYHENVVKGNRVYMDYRTDPSGIRTEADFSRLSPECYQYLKNSSALVLTPIKRLEIMNAPAIQLYKSHGIDLYHEPLEIGVCAQHINGGLAVDADWQTNITGLYAAGECAGTFGVYRPGGSALNAAQVGSMRAAEHIAYSADRQPLMEAHREAAQEEATRYVEIFDSIGRGKSNIAGKMLALQQKMSRSAGHLRQSSKIKVLLDVLESAWRSFYDSAVIEDRSEIVRLVKSRDILLTQYAVASAILMAGETAGSRGSGLFIRDWPEDKGFQPGDIDYIKENTDYANQILMTRYDREEMHCFYQQARSLPEPDEWFESVWKDFIDSHQCRR